MSTVSLERPSPTVPTPSRPTPRSDSVPTYVSWGSTGSESRAGLWGTSKDMSRTRHHPPLNIVDPVWTGLRESHV